MSLLDIRESQEYRSGKITGSQAWLSLSVLPVLGNSVSTAFCKLDAGTPQLTQKVKDTPWLLGGGSPPAQMSCHPESLL